MHANRPAVALYERTGDALPAAPVFNRALADRALLPRVSRAAAQLGYGLVRPEREDVTVAHRRHSSCFRRA